MNIDVIEHGPEISMPGFFSSSGTGGTFQGPLVASQGGSGAGRRPACASASIRARSARSFSARACRRSCSAARNSLKAGVNRRSAPSTASNRTRDVGVIGRRSPAGRVANGAVFAWRPYRVNGDGGPRNGPPNPPALRAPPRARGAPRYPPPNARVPRRSRGAPRYPPPNARVPRRSRGAPRYPPPNARGAPAEPWRPSISAPKRSGRPGGAVAPLGWRPEDVSGRMALPMASPRRFRGLGKGRTTRRALEHGGIGLAARLNRALGAWNG